LKSYISAIRYVFRQAVTMRQMGSSRLRVWLRIFIAQAVNLYEQGQVCGIERIIKLYLLIKLRTAIQQCTICVFRIHNVVDLNRMKMSCVVILKRPLKLLYNNFICKML
jgi:hypothetical protein